MLTPKKSLPEEALFEALAGRLGSDPNGQQGLQKGFALHGVDVGIMDVDAHRIAGEVQHDPVALLHVSHAGIELADFALDAIHILGVIFETFGPTVSKLLGADLVYEVHSEAFALPGTDDGVRIAAFALEVEPDDVHRGTMSEFCCL